MPFVCLSGNLAHKQPHLPWRFSALWIGSPAIAQPGGMMTINKQTFQPQRPKRTARNTTFINYTACTATNMKRQPHPLSPSNVHNRAQQRNYTLAFLIFTSACVRHLALSPLDPSSPAGCRPPHHGHCRRVPAACGLAGAAGVCAAQPPRPRWCLPCTQLCHCLPRKQNCLLASVAVAEAEEEEEEEGVVVRRRTLQRLLAGSCVWGLVRLVGAPPSAPMAFFPLAAEWRRTLEPWWLRLRALRTQWKQQACSSLQQRHQLAMRGDQQG